ncbi:MAG: hypothetical protein AAF740_02170 [Bacteroidota bacterium]
MENIFRLAFRAFLWFRGYQFYRVTSKEETAEITAFGNQIFREAGYAAENFELMQRYKSNSDLFVAKHKRQPVAMVRLTKAHQNCRLQDFWNLNLPQEVELSELRELGSLAVKKSYRGKSQLPIMGLLDIALAYSIKNNIKWWYASATARDYRNFRRFISSCQLLEELPITERQRTFREKYATYFSGAPSRATLFILKVEKKMYSQNIVRMLMQKLRLRKKTMEQHKNLSLPTRVAYLDSKKQAWISA